MESRIDGALGEVQRASAALPEHLHDRVAVGRRAAEDRQQQQIQLPVGEIVAHVCMLTPHYLDCLGNGARVASPPGPRSRAGVGLNPLASSQTPNTISWTPMGTARVT